MIRITCCRASTIWAKIKQLSGNPETEVLAGCRKAFRREPKNPIYLDHLAASLDLNGDTNSALTALVQE